jgi:hypothetical protein
MVLEAVRLTLSRRQATALNLLNDPTVVELCYGGGAGGGKSMMVGIWAVTECARFPGIAIGIGRKELTQLEKTTLVTILTEVHPLLGVTEHDFKYNGKTHTLTYKNGSQLVLVDLDYQPRDPLFERFGSLNLTHTIIEEAGELQQKAVSVFSSRNNRKLNKLYGIVGKTVMTCNPSLNFLRKWYDMYETLGGGLYQKWEHGEVEIPEGGTVKAYRVFLRSLPTDNPFLSKNYILRLRQLPIEDRKRLLEGNWDFMNNERALFKIRAIQSALAPSIHRPGDQDYGSIDVARSGDKIVFAHQHGIQLVDMHVLDIVVTETTAVMPKVAREWIKWCQDRKIGYKNAIADASGLGDAFVDICRDMDWYPHSFKGGNPGTVFFEENTNDEEADNYEWRDGKWVEKKGKPKYANLRSESYWEYKLRIEDGRQKILKDMPYYEELKQELLAQERNLKKEDVIALVPKDEIILQLGHSPDFSDAATMVGWLSWQAEIEEKAAEEDGFDFFMG